MKRNEVIQVRLEPELKELLKAKGDMSAYVRDLIAKDLGLSNGGAAWTESQPKGQGLAGPTGVSVPVAEPDPDGKILIGGKTVEYVGRLTPPTDSADADLAEKAHAAMMRDNAPKSSQFSKLVKQLEAQGKSPAEAQERARRRLS